MKKLYLVLLLLLSLFSFSTKATSLYDLSHLIYVNYLEDIDSIDLEEYQTEYTETLFLEKLGGLTVKEKKYLFAPITKATIKELLDYIVATNTTNQYLINFLDKAFEHGDFPTLQTYLDDEGTTIIPKALTYGVILNRLVHIMKKNPQVLLSLFYFWEHKRYQYATLFDYESLFNYAKYFTQLEGLKKYFSFLAGENVPKNFGSFLLPLNITEAILVDITNGSYDNAIAGSILSMALPGSKELNPITGRAPTEISDDGIMSFHFPHSKEYADLYGTWNMAFVSAEFPEFPFFLMKLLVPEVSDYSRDPATYMHQRALALYVHMNFYLFTRVHAKNVPYLLNDWVMPDVVQLWGKVNRESAMEYKDLFRGN